MTRSRCRRSHEYRRSSPIPRRPPLWRPARKLSISEELTTTSENGIAGDVDETGVGLGLVGMRERAAVNGGRSTIGADGDRLAVEAWLPTDRKVAS